MAPSMFRKGGQADPSTTAVDALDVGVARPLGFTDQIDELVR